MNIPSLLRSFGLRPDKSLGQNFLVDEAAIDKIVDIAEISTTDSVLEIGPGVGGLTARLAERAGWVVAVELDPRLIPVLKRVLSPYSNVNLLEGDILALDPAQIMDAPGYQVVANIPYYITSPLIRHLLEARHQPRRLVLTVQREVANRICAIPGELSLLALSVQVYGKPNVRAHIPPGAFYPAPQVDSAVVRVDLYPQPLVPNELLGAFFRLAKAGFSQKRKMLSNALAASLACPKEKAQELLLAASIDPRRRAQTLSIDEWYKLAQGFTQTSL